MRHSIALLALLAGAAGRARADVSLIGTFDTKAAILSIDGGAPKTVKVGQSARRRHADRRREGPRHDRSGRQAQACCSAARPTAAAARVPARRASRSRPARAATSSPTARSTAARSASWSTPAPPPSRFRPATPTGCASTTARAGAAPRRPRAARRTVYLVTLDSVRVGGIELQNVEAIVIEQGLHVALLGNSFLNRMEMRREGQTMTLTRRF